MACFGLVLCAVLSANPASSTPAPPARPTPRDVALVSSVRDVPLGLPPESRPARIVASTAPLGRQAMTLRTMLRLVNVLRSVPQKCGRELMPAVGPVTRNRRLDRAAQGYATTMARHDWFEHDAPDGTDPGTRMTRAGYRWSRWGENIAAGYDKVARVLVAWMASPGHCRTLMGNYRHVGFGHAYSRSSTFGHYWVQDFASPR